MPKAMVHTMGCRLNEGESQNLREQLQERGFEVVPSGGKADLGILNTCTVTKEADKKCRKWIRQFHRENPEAFLAVVGCYSQMGASAIADIPGVDLIIGNQEKLSVLDHVHFGKNERPVILRNNIDPGNFEVRYAGDIPFNQRANLKVQDGCDFYCSFCIIPFARGRARSRDWDNLIAEARSLGKKGVQEIVLTGVNIGTYEDGGRGIVDLVDALAEVEGLTRIRISSIEPTTVPFSLIDRMGDPTHPLLPYLHLPLQSGSNDVLRAMRRKYSKKEYREFVDEVFRRVPGICLGTDILVGFDGETEEAYEETCQFFLELPFAYTHAFPYSEREGTLSTKRGGGEIPIPERNRRCQYLCRLSAKKRFDFMESRVGTERIVLLENPKEGGYPGYTEDYIRVFVEGPREAGWENKRVRMRLDSVEADFMRGTILEWVDPIDE